MTLVDDLRRPAAKRIAHTITALTTPIWAPVALIALIAGLVNVLAELLLEFTLKQCNRLKWAAFSAYMKWRPTVLPIPTNTETDDHKYACKECGCLWRKWSNDCGWSMWDAKQKPCGVCDNGTEFLNVIERV